MCGIYQIKNIINSKVYIGQALDIEQRWYKHKMSKDNFAIHQAFRKYGIENFEFTILEECKPDQLNEREQFWIAYFDSYNKGYNETKGGQGKFGAGQVLNAAQVDEIKKQLHSTRLSYNELGSKYHVSPRTIGQINKGETWFDDNIDYPIRKEPVSRCIQLAQIDTTTGEIVAIFNSISEASRASGVSRSFIGEVSKENSLSQRTAGGFLWKRI